MEGWKFYKKRTTSPMLSPRFALITCKKKMAVQLPSLVRWYACSLLGYSFYFVLMSNFTWVSVFGLDLYLSVHKLGGRPTSEKKFFGLSVQLPLIVPVFLLALAASKFALSNHNYNDNNGFVDDFLDVHHVGLASLVTCIF